MPQHLNMMSGSRVQIEFGIGTRCASFTSNTTFAITRSFSDLPALKQTSFTSSASKHVHMCTLKGGKGSGMFPAPFEGVCVCGCLCVVLHWSVPPYRTNTTTSATPLTVTQRTFQVPSLRLQNTLAHTLYICHHERERWLWHWDTDAWIHTKTSQLVCAGSNRTGAMAETWTLPIRCWLSLNLGLCNAAWEGVMDHFQLNGYGMEPERT